MKLQFKSIGSTSKLVAWCKGFKDINTSLLIEADLDAQAFIAKCFPTSKAVLKYSKISFEDAGYEVTSITDNAGVDFDWNSKEETTTGRIVIGIYEILPKVADVLQMFSETDHNLIINFDICKDIHYIGQQHSAIEYQAETITLHSKSLHMVIKCSKISEFFEKCDDDTFINKVCKINKPSAFEVSPETISNLYKISSVFAINKASDLIKLHSKQVDDKLALYAYDESNGSYEYLLGYLTSGANKTASLVMFKENFLNALHSLTGQTMTFILDTASDMKILIEDESSKIAIARAILPK